MVYALLIDWEDALRNCKCNEIVGMLRCECEGPDVICDHKVIVPLRESCKTPPKKGGVKYTKRDMLFQLLKRDIYRTPKQQTESYHRANNIGSRIDMCSIFLNRLVVMCGEAKSERKQYPLEKIKAVAAVQL